MRRREVSEKGEFLAFYDATVAEAFSYALRLTADRTRAEDLVHDVYVQLLARVRAGTLHEPTIGLVVASVRNRFIDGVRRSQVVERRAPLLLVSDRQSHEDQIDDGLSSNPNAVLGVELSERERLALTMKYVEGMSVAEIAAALGCSDAAAYSILARARQRVREGGVESA